MGTGLETLNKRVSVYGKTQEERMIYDKLTSLKRAIASSYQAATIVTDENKEFRCLINPDKLKTDYDNKILSIPFEDIELKTNKDEKTNLKAGDVFSWKEKNSSKWLIYLIHKEEDAYLRAEIRECKFQIQLGKLPNKYWVYARGPIETKIVWDQKGTRNWNEMNLTSLIYIEKNEETEEYFKRFKKVKLDNKTWEVQAVDSISTEGIIEVTIKEDFANTIKEEEEAREDANKPVPPSPPPLTEPQIVGEREVKAFAIKTYSILNRPAGGTWLTYNSRAKIIESKGLSVTIEFSTSSPGPTGIVYRVKDYPDVRFDINVLRL